MNVKNFAVTTVTLLTGILGLGSVFAQSTPVVRPQAVIVNPVSTELKVSVALNKAGANPLYLEGENLKISVNVNQDAYVYVFDIQPTGDVTMLLPNGFPGGQLPLLRANETRTFPGAKDAYQLNIQAPFGQEKIFALASKTPLNLSAIVPQVQSGGGFVNANVQGSDGLARPLAVVVTPLPPTNWTTAFVDFTTARPVVNGTLAINSNAPNSSVTVDGNVIGNAPVNVTAAPGNHVVRVSAPGFSDFNQTVNVNAGQTTSVNARLTAIQQNGTLQILAPDGANVYVDNRLVGNGSITGVATAGAHTIRVTQNGFSEFNQVVNVNVGQTTVVDARNLQAIVTNGTLQVLAPNGANVYLDNRLVGNGSVTGTTTAGSHTVRVSQDGFSDFNQTVNVNAGQTTVVDARNLQAIVTNGTLRINTQPGAQVYVNGQFVGQVAGSSAELPLAAGQYAVSVRLDGFRNFEQTVNVNGGQTTTINANLQRIATTGVLNIVNSVRGAIVFINGQNVGKIGNNGTLSIKNLPAGTHEIVIVSPGYRAFVQAFTITGGQITTVVGSLLRL